ncbi:hypothetical protein EK0264_04275 [Epidermidibacterium keratini]|uniref:Uncharacterized protein n=1 Tax=Epidermidibacterium keratini TaxID=1891644 RepID=A0A7L4YM00_9ACTN|nr:hypothetical protein [Epidermidibacterium keratini]QHB99576.1 hypothetical protein EK0264_04275 [Epidermidibacterium keratini]
MKFAPLPDYQAADWIRRGRVAEVGTVDSLVPRVFEKYLVIPHPIWAQARASVRWSDVAARAGLDLADVPRPSRRVAELPSEVTKRLPIETSEVRLSGPDPGHLPTGVIVPLIEVLGGGDLQTSTVFATWDGWGARTPAMSAGAHVSIGSRGWYLLQAPLAMAAVGFVDGPVNQGLGPGMWWPVDRSWIVISDVDLEASYVGCSTTAADELLASDIECFLVAPDATVWG